MFRMSHSSILARAPHFANERNGSCKLSSLSPQTAFWLRLCGRHVCQSTCQANQGRGRGRIQGAFHASTPQLYRDNGASIYRIHLRVLEVSAKSTGKSNNQMAVLANETTMEQSLGLKVRTPLVTKNVDSWGVSRSCGVLPFFCPTNEGRSFLSPLVLSLMSLI